MTGEPVGPVGLVVVSHSRALAVAAVELAREMAPGELPIEVAAGLDGDGPDDPPALGTDAVAIAEAIAAADRGSGIVVLMDLGSAVLSAELALDLLADDELRDRVLLCPAPLVEGLVVAAVTAGGGASAAEVAAEASAALAGKLAQLEPPPPPSAPPGPTVPEPAGASDEPAADEPGGEFAVDLPHGLHARPAARLVALVREHAGARVRLRNRTTGSDWAPAASLARVAALGARSGHRVQLRAAGAGADEVVRAVLELAARGFDEVPAPGAVPARPASRVGPDAPVPPRQAEPVPGPAEPVPGSPGIAFGPARRFGARRRTEPTAGDPPGDPGVERARLESALAGVRDEVRVVRARTADELGPTEAAIFDAHLLLLDDPELVDAAGAAVDQGAPAAAAWATAVERAAAELDALEDPYLAARAADVRAVGEQVLDALAGPTAGPTADQDLAPGSGPVVLVAQDLTPAQAAGLDPARVVGVVLAGGSPTAHATLLLRARGVPAVLGAGAAVLELADGTPLALDGGTGELLVDPPADRAAALRARATAAAERDREARARCTEPAITRDGRQVLVGANIGSAADAAAAAAAGADLAGLVRTEFLFLGRDSAPDVDEQEAAYQEIAAALDGRRITLRTLDVGGDKPLPYLPLPAEANPFLGVRGIRLAGPRPDLLRDQLLAAVRVARQTPVSLMFPMVAAVDELLGARRVLAEVIAAEGRGEPAGLQVGIMVEVPAAALKAAAFLPYVDFLSIGTNDLVQYTLAAERGNPALSRLADPLDPAVLRLVDATCRAAEGRALVAVCGEAAADPVAAALLVGLGVGELSVVPPAVAVTKQVVRELDAGTVALAAAEALLLDGPEQVRGR